MDLICFPSTSAPWCLWSWSGAGLEAGISPCGGINQHLLFSFLLFPQEHFPSALGRCSLLEDGDRKQILLSALPPWILPRILNRIILYLHPWGPRPLPGAEWMSPFSQYVISKKLWWMFFTSHPVVSQGSGSNDEGGDDVLHGSTQNNANLSS